MNNRILCFLLVVAVVAISCKGSKKLDAIDQNVELKSEIDSLKEIVSSRDSVLSDAFTLISTISASLDEIKRQEGMMLNSGELNKNANDKFAEDIDKISERLKSNRAQLVQLEGLRKRLGDSNVQISGLDRMIKSLKSDMELRDESIRKLMARLSKMTQRIDSLSGTVSDLQDNNTALTERVIEQQRSARTRYYIIADEKALLKMGIVTRVGGLSRELKLSSDIDYTALESLDILDKTTFGLNCKKAVLVGSFPTNSYTIERTAQKELEKLIINDPEAFWRGNSVLVVATK